MGDLTVQRTFSDNSDSIECPYKCGGQINDLWDYDWDQPGHSETIVTNCDNCGGEVTLYRAISAYYTATANEPNR